MSSDNVGSGEVRIVLVGTDPVNIRGGIGRAMQGYIRALQTANLLTCTIPSYSPVARHGRWLLAVKAVPAIIRSVLTIRRSGRTAVHYGHAGSWPSMVREAFLVTISRLFGARTILQLHSPDLDDYLGSSLGRMMVRIVVSPAHALGALTPWWQRRLTGAGIRKPVVVIPNPLPSELETVARDADGRHSSAEQMKDRNVTVLSMARLVAGKGVETVIEAMALLPAYVQLIVAGDGPLKPELERLAVRKKVADRVCFAGWIAGNAKERLLAGADIFCLPSRNDSFGMCFLEAMAYSVPVIALGWGPIRDVVPDGEAGILVDESSPERVAEAIGRLLDEDLRRTLGEGGRRWTLRTFSAAAIGSKLHEELQGRVFSST